MEVRQPSAKIDFSLYWRLRRLVHRDRSMGPVPKAAWDFLLVKAHFQFGVIFEVTPAEVSHEEGKDDPRGGFEALKILAARGYIKVEDRPTRRSNSRGGPWIIFLIDPQEVAIARPGPKSHGQGELFDRPIDDSADEANILPADQSAQDAHSASIRPTIPIFSGSSADVAQSPPPSTLGVGLDISKHLTLNTYSNLKGLGCGKGGGDSCSKSANAIGDRDAEALEQIAAEQRASIGVARQPEANAAAAVTEITKGVLAHLQSPENAADEVERFTAWILKISAFVKTVQPKLARGWAELLASGAWTAGDCAATVADVQHRWERQLAGKLKPDEKPIGHLFGYFHRAMCRAIQRHDRRTQ